MPAQISSAVLAKLLSAYQETLAVENPLQEEPFMSLLDTANLQAFSARRLCPPGEIIVREDDPGDSIYIIRSGLAAVVKGDLRSPILLGFRTPGGIIGEMAVLEDQPRSATVVALEPMLLWRMSREAFDDFCSQNPRFSRQLMRMMSARLRNSDAERSQEAEIGRQREAAIRQMREQAVRDSLTGLFNRRYLEETLAREIARARREGSTVGILMLDIDRFKRVNDTYGHPAGDAVLRALGQLLADHVRDEDIPCRYGGEEFVVVLPDVPRAITRKRAEQIRQAFQDLRMTVEGPAGPTEISATLSVGGAVYPQDGENGNMVLSRADQALYQAKAAGRNRVILFQEAGKATGSDA